MRALIAICGRLGYALGMLTAIDPLSAFPATSRGGVDSVMIAANRTLAVPLLVAGFVAGGAHAAAAAAS